jgi:hypothetical protein
LQLKKLALDQLVFAPTIMTAFFTYMDLLEGRSSGEIVHHLRKVMPGALLANYQARRRRRPSLDRGRSRLRRTTADECLLLLWALPFAAVASSESDQLQVCACAPACVLCKHSRAVLECLSEQRAPPASATVVVGRARTVVLHFDQSERNDDDNDDDNDDSSRPVNVCKCCRLGRRLRGK